MSGYRVYSSGVSAGTATAELAMACSRLSMAGKVGLSTGTSVNDGGRFKHTSKSIWVLGERVALDELALSVVPDGL